MRMRDFSWIIIPAVFVATYTYIGIVAWDHLYYVLVGVDGHVLVAMPPHWGTYYNSRDGPISSIFLSNFLFDGWSNTWIFAIYTVIFVLTNVEIAASNRLFRGILLVVGSLLAAFVSGVLVRFFLVPGQFGYGQSAVLAGFAGITVYFLVENLLVGDTRKKVLHNPVQGAGYIFLAIIGIFLLGIFFLATPTAIIAHLSAMVSGIVLAGLYSVVVHERGRVRNRKTTLLIPEKVRA